MKAAACLKGSPAVAAVALLLLLYYFVLPHIDKYLEVTTTAQNIQIRIYIIYPIIHFTPPSLIDNFSGPAWSPAATAGVERAGWLARWEPHTRQTTASPACSRVATPPSTSPSLPNSLPRQSRRLAG